MRRLAPREVVFVAMILAIFMVSVEATIVATALPTIVGDLGGLRYFSWVFGAYLLTQAVSIPIYGRLADFFGRKALLIVAICVFLTGSILCGFAHSMIALIAFRALQGFGGGGVQPVATTIVGDLYSGGERARVQGFLSSTWAFAAVIGPLLGAFLVQHIGWPVIFWLNVPVGIACIFIVLRNFSETIVRVRHQIDVLGSLLLGAGVGLLMFVLVMLGNIAPPLAVALGALAIAIIAVLLVHELRTPEPMMPLFLYKIRMIASSNAGNFLMGAMLMGVSAFLPTFVQGALGGSAVVAGAVLGSIFVSWCMASIAGARIVMRTDYRTVALCATAPLLIGAAMLATLDVRSSFAYALAGVTALGFAFGFLNCVFVLSTQSAVGWELRGAATSSNIFLRQLGQSIGSAAFAAVFNLAIYARIPNASTVVGELMDPVKRALIDPADRLRDATAVAQSLHGVYLILAALAVAEVALIFTLPAKERPQAARGSALA